MTVLLSLLKTKAFTLRLACVSICECDSNDGTYKKYT